MRTPYSTLGEITEANNLARFEARREQRRRQLLKDIANDMEATPPSNSRGAQGVARHQAPRPALDPITIAALIGLGWLLGLLLMIGALVALVRWVWDVIWKLVGGN